jgi:hypothetical protein
MVMAESAYHFADPESHDHGHFNSRSGLGGECRKDAGDNGSNKSATEFLVEIRARHAEPD